MSFVGAVAASVRQVLAGYAREIDLPVLICGAGNFTVPSVLRSGGYAGRISACDVTLYTSALGAALTGRDLAVREREDCPEQLRGLLRTGTPDELAASVALLLDLRECWQRKNPYQVRQFDGLAARWDELLETTMAKLAAYREHVGEIEYAAEDGFAFLARHEPEHCVFAFPPTYKRGYERLEALFHAALEWQAPEYREMTDKSLELYEQILGFEAWFVVLEKGPDELPEVFDMLGAPAAVLPRGRGRNTYIMSRLPERPVVLRQAYKSAASGPAWPPDRVVTGDEEPGLAVLSLPQTLRLNEMFLSKRIDFFTGGVGLSLGFLLDGLLVGKADFCPSAHQWKLPEALPMIYLMCDLAVPSAVEARLAKLVLHLLRSREVSEQLDVRWLERFGWVITTAFAKGPVSMKYRGLFKLHKRAPQDGGFALNYYARLGEWDLKDGLKAWRKKHAK